MTNYIMHTLVDCIKCIMRSVKQREIQLKFRLGDANITGNIAANKN